MDTSQTLLLSVEDFMLSFAVLILLPQTNQSCDHMNNNTVIRDGAC